MNSKIPSLYFLLIGQILAAFANIIHLSNNLYDGYTYRKPAFTFGAF